MDLKGVGLGKVGSVYGYVKQASAISQNYYPERLGKLYLINAPWGFSSVFSIIKGFLDPVTVQKIHVLGAGYHAELEKQVAKENLPKIFGGTCECAKGCALSDEGPWQDPQWAKPPKWAAQSSKAEEGAGSTATAITNKPTTDSTIPSFVAPHSHSQVGSHPQPSGKNVGATTVEGGQHAHAPAV